MRNSLQVFNDHEDVWDVLERAYKWLGSTNDPKDKFTICHGELMELRGYIRDLEKELDKAAENSQGGDI